MSRAVNLKRMLAGGLDAMCALNGVGRSTTGEVVHVDAGFRIVGVPDTGGANE